LRCGGLRDRLLCRTRRVFGLRDHLIRGFTRLPLFRIRRRTLRLFIVARVRPELRDRLFLNPTVFFRKEPRIRRSLHLGVITSLSNALTVSRRLRYHLWLHRHHRLGLGLGLGFGGAHTLSPSLPTSALYRRRLRLDLGCLNVFRINRVLRFLGDRVILNFEFGPLHPIGRSA